MPSPAPSPAARGTPVSTGIRRPLPEWPDRHQPRVSLPYSNDLFVVIEPFVKSGLGVRLVRVPKTRIKNYVVKRSLILFGHPAANKSECWPTRTLIIGKP